VTFSKEKHAAVIRTPQSSPAMAVMALATVCPGTGHAVVWNGSTFSVLDIFGGL
jgi:hypothetical protein